MADNKQIISTILDFLERYAAGVTEDQSEALEGRLTIHIIKIVGTQFEKKYLLRLL